MEVVSPKFLRIAVPLLSLLLLTEDVTNAANLVQNGSFENSIFPGNYELANSSFNPLGATDSGVTGWYSDANPSGTPTFSLWFDAATATSVSAVSQYSSEPQQLAAAYGTTPAPDGTHFIALDGDETANGLFHQDISGLVIGQTYKLSFSWAAVQLSNRTGPTTERLEFNLGSGPPQTTLTYNLPSQGFSGWMEGGGLFVAGATTETLSFLAIGTPGGLPPMVLLDAVSLQAVPEPTSLALSALGLIGMGSIAVRRRMRSNA